MRNGTGGTTLDGKSDLVLLPLGVNFGLGVMNLSNSDLPIVVTSSQ